MNDKYISSLHIQKLGHEIQEIRERALLNINSKLDHGFHFDNDLARSKEILTKLFDWFLFSPCTKQELVFSLIKRILSSEAGKTLINHNGNLVFKKQLQRICTYIEPKYYENLEAIGQILDLTPVIVPLLETDIPLSYRTGQSDLVGTTATTIEGFIQQDASGLQRNTPESVSSSSHFRNSDYTIKWQFLIEADRHVLQSIEDSLKNPPQPVSLLHSADFFSNILLHDFPAEVFLQRPNIVMTFYDLVANCPSTRVVNSVLNCLNGLTRALEVRVNHHNDPCLHSAKENINCNTSRSSTPDSTSRKTVSGQSEDYLTHENVEYLKTQQISFPQYCFLTFNCIFKYLRVKPGKKVNQRGVNLALDLLDEVLNLLDLISIQEVHKNFQDVLIGYGDSLEYFRIEASSDDSNINNRITQLCFLHNCANFLTRLVPLSQTGLIIPRVLKTALANSLVDVILPKLYPNLYNTLLNYVQSFESDALRKYHETNNICESMTAAVDFMRNCKTLNAREGISLAKKALPSLEFHQDLIFVKQVIQLCANKLTLYPHDDDLLEKFEFVILKLLSHNLDFVREETYRLCQKRVIAAVGPKLNMAFSGVPGAQILFLCTSNVMVEIACHGITSENVQIRNHSEDILIHLIKCKILVSDDIWNKIVQALIGSLPILLCHCNKASSLGRSLLDILDPDTAQSLNLSKSEVVKGNVHLLFGTDSRVREEAFSRLCWLLATQPDSREMLPRLNNLYDKALPNACRIQRIVDVNKIRATQHFYQPSSLQQVLDLLKSVNVEPVIRRSALTQISVMMEDPLLHTTFLSSGGLEIVLEIIKSALVEQNYHDYPDSVIPAISILKFVCLFQASARQRLREDIEVWYNILRSLFMFFTEEKVKHDAACLLFLMVFTDFIRGTPSKANFSIPYLVSQRVQIPFVCDTHWEISQNYDTSLAETLTSDRWCLSSLQIQWNSEMFGGLDELLTWNRVDYAEHNVTEILKLTNYDLQCLKASSIDYCVRKYLISIQNGTVHDAVVDSIDKLRTYVHLSSLVPKRDSFLEHPWETTFTRFLKLLPSSEEDSKLLSNILKFLRRLLPFYKSISDTSWLPQMLKNPSNSLLDLITVDQSSTEDFKTLSQDLLSVINLCASLEQHFLDFYTYSKFPPTDFGSWSNVIEIIANSLKFNDSTHFYNLAYLDSLLACLATLTASLGWTESKPNSPPKRILFQLVSSLCELVVVFHCGKGPTATISVMGLSITRHVILILNHLVAEMLSLKMKNWERCFMEVEEEEWLKSFLVLWSSRDVLLRAGALQLFAGLAVSPILAINIVNELKNENGGVWNMALSLLMDHDEASVVRENCAFLIGNLLGHTSKHSNKTVLVTSLVPNTMRKGKGDATTIFDLLDDHQFFKNVVTILTRLYTLNVSTGPGSLVTPSLVKSVTVLLQNLLALDEEHLSWQLQDSGIVKVLFRCVCSPAITVSDTKKLALYCEILDMNVAICSLLRHTAFVNFTSLGTLIHTRDCLQVLVSLLNPRIYDTHLPQLLYLRNKLWSEIFNLLSVLTTYENQSEYSREAIRIITDAIEESGKEAFVQTICEATKSLSYADLQNSALLSLTSLLNTESEQIKSSGSSSSRSSIFGSSPRTDDGEMAAGTEICKILINLYDLCTLKPTKDLVRKKSVITSSLTCILCVSLEAKTYALEQDLPALIIKQLKDFYIKLSLESVDCLRKVLDKKGACPVLRQLNELVGLVTNFMVGDEAVKVKFAELGLSDFVHKLWVWFALQRTQLSDVLRMLCTFTNGCHGACHSLTLTSSAAGSIPRKIPSRISLLNVIILLIEREMEQVSKTHTLDVLELSFEILNNCCAVLECRTHVCKSALFSSVSRLHPAITKKQKPWDSVELIWLRFLQNFTFYPEGQSNVAKINDMFELILALASNSKVPNRVTALTVLRNIAFYQPNRSRLLTSDDFLNLLKNKLENGNQEEKATVVLIMWSLAANNQKAKIVFKAAKLDTQLQQVLKQYQLAVEATPDGDIETMKYVLNVIKDGDSSL